MKGLRETSDIHFPALLKRDNRFYRVKKGDPFGDIFAAEFLTKIWRPVEKPKLFDSHRLELQ